MGRNSVDKVRAGGAGPRGILICGVIAAGGENLGRAKAGMSEVWGPIGRESAILPFDYTTYYEEEMGGGLVRQFLAFAKVIGQERLPEFKHQAMALEAELGDESSGRLRRRANIDPGYLSLERLVLATTKNFIHRVYLRDGIFADLTLVFRSETFVPLEWTYPDYRTPQAIEFFNQVREEFKVDLRG